MLESWKVLFLDLGRRYMGVCFMVAVNFFFTFPSVLCFTIKKLRLNEKREHPKFFRNKNVSFMKGIAISSSLCHLTSVHLFTYLPTTQPSIHPYIHPFIPPSLHPPLHQSILLFIFPFTIYSFTHT